MKPFNYKHSANFYEFLQSLAADSAQAGTNPNLSTVSQVALPYLATCVLSFSLLIAPVMMPITWTGGAGQALADCIPANNGTNNNDTIVCDTANDAGGSHVRGYNGDDVITLNGTATVGRILAGNDVDTINLISGTVNSNVYWDAGDESGTLDLTHVTLKGRLYFGEGSDDFTLTAGTVGEHVYLGSGAGVGTGSDVFTLSGGTVTGSVYGDADQDSINLNSGSIGDQIRGYGGDDVISLNGTGTVDHIRGNDGADTINLIGGTVTGDVYWDAGDESGTLDLTHVTLGGSLSFGDGTDVFTLTGGTVGSHVYLGSGSNAGTGADEFTLAGGTVTNNIYGDADQDTINLTGGNVGGQVLGWGGDDVINLNGTATVDDIRGGNGADTITLNNGTVIADVFWDEGDDSGTLDLTNVTLGGSLSFGDGADVFSLTGGTVGSHVYLGSGSNAGTGADVFTLAGGTVTNNINGDADQDTINLTSGNVGGQVLGNDGDDVIALNGTAAVDDIHGGNGADTIILTDGTVSGNVFWDAGNESGTLDLTHVILGGSLSFGDGADVFSLTGGTVGEHVYLGSGSNIGSGADVFTLSGGDVTNNIYGDADQDTINLNGGAVGGQIQGNDGDDVFNWSGGTLAGAFRAGSGSDNASVSTSGYNGTSHVLDGGDDYATADGWSDVLTFSGGISTSANGANVINWENVVLDNATLNIADGKWQVGDDADPATGLALNSGSALDAGSSLTFSGNMSIDAASVFRGGGVGAGAYSISGNLGNAGTVSTRDGVVGDVITVAGDYTGGGKLLVDANFSTNTVDTLEIGGSVMGGVTTIEINNVTTGLLTGDDVLIIDVTGTTVAGDFKLAAPVTMGAYRYALGLVGSDWYLQASRFVPDGGSSSSIGVAEITVTGNDLPLVNGDNLPQITDHSQFAETIVGETTTRTFTIINHGTASLSLSGVTLTGSHSADFSVITQPATSLDAASSTVFQVAFTPSEEGIREAVINIANSDSNENPFYFSIEGTGTTASTDTENSEQDSDGDGIPDAIELLEGTDPNVKDNDVVGNNRHFVMQLYRNFLFREGGEIGISYWTTLLGNQDQNRNIIVNGFLNSEEVTYRISPVIRLYFSYFNRLPDLEGLKYWINLMIGQGSSLALVSAQFATSIEFQTTYGNLDDSAFVQLVYQNVFSREADTEGLTFWTNQLQQGEVSRGQLMVDFSESAEYIALTEDGAIVTMLYLGLFNRMPDTDEVNYWTAELDAGIDLFNLIDMLLDSEEFAALYYEQE